MAFTKTPSSRVCLHCLKRLPIVEFFKNHEKRGGIRPECKTCTYIRRASNKLRRAK